MNKPKHSVLMSFLLSLPLLAAVTACQKRDTLAGTTWFCDRDGSEMIFMCPLLREQHNYTGLIERV